MQEKNIYIGNYIREGTTDQMWLSNTKTIAHVDVTEW